MDSLERYQLGIFLRFSELESELGRSPKKIALHRLRKVRSWPSYVPDDDGGEKGTGDGPSLPVGSQVTEELGVGVRVFGLESENGSGNTSSNTRLRSSPFSDNAKRKVPYESTWTRRERRAAREEEYTKRRLAEFEAVAASRRPEPGRVNPPPTLFPKQAAARADIRRRLGEVRDQDIDLRYSSREFPPPQSLIDSDAVRSYTGSKKPVARLPKGYLASRDGPLTRKAETCLVKLGCVRPEGHKGSCLSSGCERKFRHFRCSRTRDHLGPCDWIGWTCPDCGVPYGRPHSRPDCPTRIKRAKTSSSSSRVTLGA